MHAEVYPLAVCLLGLVALANSPTPALRHQTRLHEFLVVREQPRESHDISRYSRRLRLPQTMREGRRLIRRSAHVARCSAFSPADRKSTRLNSSHLGISYAVFCL